MRRPRLAAIVVAFALGSPAGLARAEPPVDPDADDQGDFWGSVLAPGGVEIATLLEAGRHQVALARQAAEGRGDARFRAQRLREATAVAGRIRALDPRAPSLDFLLGLIADEAGRTAAAERHLAAFATRIEPGTLRTEALLRIGRIALVRRDAAAASGPLRAALAEQRTRADRAQALVLLAQALDDGGDLDGAIALLAGAIDRSQGPGETDDNGVWLALVAAYDRDEQVSASLELIERLKGALGADYVARLAAGLDAHPPVPLAAAWYQRALVYETGELLVAARAAWTTYLGLAPGTRYRARAQAHLDAIDVALATRRAPTAAGRRPGARP